MNYEEYVGFSEQGCDRSILKDTRGVKRTRTLFLEAIEWEQVQGGYEPLYTLCPDEKKGLPSAYQVFINSTTEEEAALKLVGSLPHWRFLLQKEWFLLGDPSNIPGFEGVEVWRADMRDLKKARTIRLLEKQANMGNVAAMKQLLIESDKLTRKNLTIKQKVKGVPKSDSVTSLLQRAKDRK